MHGPSQQPSGTQVTATSTHLCGTNAGLPHPSSTSALVLSPAAEPFPCKLVDKVNSDQFIEMRELLADSFPVNWWIKSILTSSSRCGSSWLIHHPPFSIAQSHAWILSASLSKSFKASTPRCILTDILVLLFPGIFGHNCGPYNA